MVDEHAPPTVSEIFANAFQYSGTGMALVSTTGRFLQVNKSLCTMLGYTAEELLALTFQEITHPEDLKEDLQYLNRILTRELETYCMRKRYRSKSGSIVWAKLTVSMAWKEDQPQFFISQIEDITHEKTLQDDLTKQNITLNAAVETLQFKIRQLDEINNIIGHNFRGAIANINLLTNLYHDESRIFEHDEIINMIEQCSTSMLQSLNTIAELSAPISGAGAALETCSFATTFERVQLQLKGIISDLGAKIVVQWDVPEIRYSQAYLESILLNLLSNALKYARRDTPPIILISTYRQSGKTVLSVKDNGMGIDLEQYGDRLFRLHQTFHDGFDSKGIGLFLVRSQVESLGGSITVSSEVDQGTQFLITF